MIYFFTAPLLRRGPRFQRTSAIGHAVRYERGDRALHARATEPVRTPEGSIQDAESSCCVRTTRTRTRKHGVYLGLTSCPPDAHLGTVLTTGLCPTGRVSGAYRLTVCVCRANGSKLQATSTDLHRGARGARSARMDPMSWSVYHTGPVSRDAVPPWEDKTDLLFIHSIEVSPWAIRSQLLRSCAPTHPSLW